MRLEEWPFAFCDTLARCFKQWLEETFNLFRVAVVSVERDEYVVLFSEQVCGFGKYDRTEGCICNIETRSELAASCGNLDDAVGLSVGE